MRILSKTKAHKKMITVVILVGMFALIVIFVSCYYIIEPSKKYISSLDSSSNAKVGVVLGAGINRMGKPYDELKARLDSAADALDHGVVTKLILSGDNRSENYDEPTAMKQYLENKGVPADKLVLDYAGRSTYESCERAAKIFGVRKTVIFSAGSHLPRAIYLCRHFGIEAYGIDSGVEANNSARREPLARVKAVYNIFVLGEPTVLGDPIPLN